MDCPSQKPDETADRQTERVKQQIAHEADTISAVLLAIISGYPTIQGKLHAKKGAS